MSVPGELYEVPLDVIRDRFIPAEPPERRQQRIAPTLERGRENVEARHGDAIVTLEHPGEQLNERKRRMVNGAFRTVSNTALPMSRT